MSAETTPFISHVQYMLCLDFLNKQIVFAVQTIHGVLPVPDVAFSYFFPVFIVCV